MPAAPRRLPAVPRPDEPRQGRHRAVAVAMEAGLPLKIAGKMREPDEKRVLRRVRRPHLGDGIEYLGEVTHGEKVELLQNARATLFPIEWEEPFGLVMIESMACGTPVIATRRGAVPEVIERRPQRDHRRRLPRDGGRARAGGRADRPARVPPLRRGAFRRSGWSPTTRARTSRRSRLTDELAGRRGSVCSEVLERSTDENGDGLARRGACASAVRGLRGPGRVPVLDELPSPASARRPVPR